MYKCIWTPAIQSLSLTQRYHAERNGQREAGRNESPGLARYCARIPTCETLNWKHPVQLLCFLQKHRNSHPWSMWCLARCAASSLRGLADLCTRNSSCRRDDDNSCRNANSDGNPSLDHYRTQSKDKAKAPGRQYLLLTTRC